jgi:polyphosphate kinase 2 (PPK2 family)
MLEKVDLDKKLKRQEWKQLRVPLQNRLYDLQKAAYDVGMPAVLVFEGWDAAGKGTSVNLLTQRLDPRGFKVWPIRAARTYEMNHPWLWRFWLKLPNRGEIGIFDRSWYGRVLVERVENFIPEDAWRKAFRDIVDFEHMLAEDGHVIVKFWFHISRDEQRRRFKMLERDPLESWRVQPEDWEHHRKYDTYLQAAEEMLERTDTEWGPWVIVEATDQCYTWWKVLTSVTDVLDRGLRLRGINPDNLSAEAMAARAALPAPDSATAAAPAKAVGQSEAIAEPAEGGAEDGTD